MSDYVAHLARDEHRASPTACGEPWQGWQAPEEIDLIPDSVVLPPHHAPRPHEDPIRFCQACRAAAYRLGDSAQREAAVT